MAANGYGGPVTGHVGRIPNFGKTNVNPMCNVEPPACIQNAMMTKDKKPFTYTPGGLDLSQIRTPSMARRMAKQRSSDEQEQYNYPNGNSAYNPQGGSAPPPPPTMPQPPPPPPPPALVINVSKPKSPKPTPIGERPEIVIPENPIGMLRKTNSPYHWETEKAELEKLGPVPKFVEKSPSPQTITVPQQFTQQPPQRYNMPNKNFSQQQNLYHTPESSLYKPEAQYMHQNSNSPSSPQVREHLLRQDSQFNKSPQPFTGQSPISNGAPFSPSPNNNWKQPDRRDSPGKNTSPQSPSFSRTPFISNMQTFSPNKENEHLTGPSDPIYHTLPRDGQRNLDNPANNTIHNNVVYSNNRPEYTNTAPWRNTTQNKQQNEREVLPDVNRNSQNTNQEATYSPPWKSNGNNVNQHQNSHASSWKPESKINNPQQQSSPPQQQYVPPWVRHQQESNNNRVTENDRNTLPSQEHFNRITTTPQQSLNQEPRYQSTISIPVTPKKQNTQTEPKEVPQQQKEAVYVNQEPIYYCPESPKSIPPWVRAQKEKTKTPPPAWVQKPLERKSAPRDLFTPPRDTSQEPEWVRKSSEMQNSAREVTSPPKYQQPQPTWSTRPSENRNVSSNQGSRVIPVQIESSHSSLRQGNQPQLRIIIDNNNNQNGHFSQPTQRIMRVLSPQLVRLDDGSTQTELPSLNKNLQKEENKPKTRIIPIQIEDGGNSGTNKSFGGRY